MIGPCNNDKELPGLMNYVFFCIKSFAMLGHIVFQMIICSIHVLCVVQRLVVEICFVAVHLGDPRTGNCYRTHCESCRLFEHHCILSSGLHWRRMVWGTCQMSFGCCQPPNSQDIYPVMYIRHVTELQAKQPFPHNLGQWFPNCGSQVMFCWVTE